MNTVKFKDAVKTGAGVYLGMCLMAAAASMLAEKLGIETKK